MLSKFLHNKDIFNAEIEFLDLNGVEKVITIPKKRLKKIKRDGLSCDGSSVHYKTIEDSDMKIFPDLLNVYPLPNKNILIFCDVDSEYDPRKKLKNLERFLQKKEYIVNVGVELEFFLFNKVSTTNFNNLAYFGYEENSQMLCLNDIINFCKNADIKIEAFHHECGKDQFEIDFKYDSPTKTADRVVFLKRIIKHFALKYNLDACFLPKPLINTSGSGMHINISVYNKRKNKNLLFDKCNKFKLSEFGCKFIDGVFDHIGAITAISNPILNSYKRLNSGYETPNKISASFNNRNALIRIPSASKNSMRIELRSPDISCNPYLTFLAVLMSGFEFLLNNQSGNISKVKSKHLSKLPKTLKQAIKYLKSDNYLSNLVNEYYFNEKLSE